MKKVVTLTLFGLLTSQSYAQSLGNRIEGVKKMEGENPADVIDKSLLRAELYAKKSIVASIRTAEELNREIGLNDMVDNHEIARVAVPLAAIGVLELVNQFYRVSNNVLQEMPSLIVPQATIDRFVSEIQQIEETIEVLQMDKTIDENDLEHLKKESLEYVDKKNSLISQTDSIDAEIKKIEGDISSIRGGKSRGVYASTEKMIKSANGRIEQLSQEIERKKSLLSELSGEIKKISDRINKIDEKINSKLQHLSEIEKSISVKNGKLSSALTLATKKARLRATLSKLGSVLGSALLLGGVSVAFAVISDVVIVEIPNEDLNKILESLDADIQNLEAAIVVQ